MKQIAMNNMKSSGNEKLLDIVRDSSMEQQTRLDDDAILLRRLFSGVMYNNEELHSIEEIR